MSESLPRIKMSDCYLYAIASPKDAARRLNVNLEDLLQLSSDARNFRVFTVKAEGKKPRKVQEPKPKLQAIHRRVALLLARIEVPDYLHSAVRGRSYVTNASAHMGHSGALKLDMRDFFNSVSRANIFNFFSMQMKCRRDVAGLLADLLTFENHLSTGSCVSPIISYFAFKPLFDQLDAFATANSLTMTCYVDDLTFSGIEATREMLWRLRLMVRGCGLKSHKVQFLKMSKPRIITGVCITDAGMRVPFSLKRKIAANVRSVKSNKEEQIRRKSALQLIGRLDAAGQIESAYKDRAKHARDLYSYLLI